MKIPSISELKRIGNERIKTSSTLWHCCISVMGIFQIHTLQCRWKVTLKNNFHDTKIVCNEFYKTSAMKNLCFPLCNFVINFCDWQWAICAVVCSVMWIFSRVHFTFMRFSEASSIRLKEGFDLILTGWWWILRFIIKIFW